jgi:hypothetical protein
LPSTYAAKAPNAKVAYVGKYGSCAGGLFFLMLVGEHQSESGGDDEQDEDDQVGDGGV